MNKELYIFNKLHKKTSRDYIARMLDDKVHCMEKAKEYEFDYWDGDKDMDMVVINMMEDGKRLLKI